MFILNMKPEQRQQHILCQLRAIHQEWRVDELAKALGVSSLTIRRDLDALAATGTIVRTFGGCMAISRVQNSVYQQRIAANFERKAAIGRAAAAEIKAGDTIIINDGSTTFHLATCMGQCGAVTVYTNSVAMINEFSRFPHVRLYLLGGEYHRELFFLGGSLMDRVLETIEADRVFVGADAIDAQGRCLAVDQDTARTAQMMLRRGRRKILLADDTKVRATGRVAYGALRNFDMWITTPGAAPELMKRFRKQTTIKAVPL